MSEKLEVYHSIEQPDQSQAGTPGVGCDEELSYGQKTGEAGLSFIQLVKGRVTSPEGILRDLTSPYGDGDEFYGYFRDLGC